MTGGQYAMAGLLVGAIGTFLPYCTDEGSPEREPAPSSATYYLQQGEGPWDAVEACTHSAAAFNVVWGAVTQEYGLDYEGDLGEPIEMPEAVQEYVACP